MPIYERFVEYKNRKALLSTSRAPASPGVQARMLPCYLTVLYARARTETWGTPMMCANPSITWLIFAIFGGVLLASNQYPLLELKVLFPASLFLATSNSK